MQPTLTECGFFFCTRSVGVVTWHGSGRVPLCGYIFTVKKVLATPRSFENVLSSGRSLLYQVYGTLLRSGQCSGAGAAPAMAAACVVGTAQSTAPNSPRAKQRVVDVAA